MIAKQERTNFHICHLCKRLIKITDFKTINTICLELKESGMPLTHHYDRQHPEMDKSKVP